MGLIVAAIALACAPALAQTLDTGDIERMSVDDVVNHLQEWKLWILLVGTGLVIALLLAGGMLRPGGLADAGKRDVKPVPVAIWLFAGLVVMLALAAAGEVLGRVEWFNNSEFTDDQRSTIVGLTGYLFAGIAGLGMVFVLGKMAPEGGLKVSPLDAAVGLGCFALAFPIVELSSMLGGTIYTQLTDGQVAPVVANPLIERVAEDLQNPWSWAIIGGLVVGKPLYEEIVYRVFVQSAFVRLWSSPWLSIIAASLSFALMTRLLSGVGSDEPIAWHSLLPLVALGLTGGVAYERTKRVGVPITMHGAYVAVQLCLALVAGPEAADPAAGGIDLPA